MAAETSRFELQHEVTETQERLAYAGAWAAATVPAICTVGYEVVAWNDGSYSIVAVKFVSIFLFLVGWPCALACAALIAFMFGKQIIDGNWLAAGCAILAATACGHFLVPIVWKYYNDLDGLRIMTITGTIAGFVAGAYFCFLARFDRP